MWDDDVFTSHADFNEAKDAFEHLLSTYLRAAEDDDAKVVLCYSCPSRHYFRHDILETYKGNRKGSPPLALRDLKQWSSEKWETKTKPNLEADDVLGILATHPRLIKDKVRIIVSADKDLQQIPGLHISTGDVGLGVFRVQQKWSEAFLWTQTLTGDPTDNYPGCPGVGPAKAAKILSGVTGEAQYAAACLAAFEKAGLTARELEQQHNVARILTADTYNFRKKEPILWQM